MPTGDDTERFKRMLNEAAAQVNDAVNPFIGIHTVYTQMIKAGFKQQEACTIIGVWFGYQNSAGSADSE